VERNNYPFSRLVIGDVVGGKENMHEVLRMMAQGRVQPCVRKVLHDMNNLVIMVMDDFPTKLFEIRTLDFYTLTFQLICLII